MYMGELALILFLFSVAGSYSDFRFANYYADHMVLQRSPKRAILWGFGENRAPVAVTVLGRTYETNVASDSQGFHVWKVILDPISYGGPSQVDAESTVGGKKTKVSLKNILFGDVWICSGQSNMVFTTGMAFNGEEEIEMAAHYSNIRVFTVDRFMSDKPLEELYIRQQWSVANKYSIGGGAWDHFSALCWMYGRRLYDLYKVPIGLISSSLGSTPIEAWSSPEALAECGISSVSTRTPFAPSSVWNGMIYPLLKFSIYGVIWYQGEANAKQSPPLKYSCSFPALIKSWRREWHVGTSGCTYDLFPFGFVQLAPVAEDYDYKGFPALRWEQTANYGYVPNPKQKETFMAIAMDLPDPNSPYGSIHPREKTTIAERLLLGARAVAYKEKYIYWTGPIFERIELDKQRGKILNIIVHYNLSTVRGYGVELRSNRGFEVSFDKTVSEWSPVYITSSSRDSVSLSITEISNGIIYGVRYAWNKMPCLYKRCAVYASNTDLPSPPFIAYGPFQVKMKTDRI